MDTKSIDWSKAPEGATHYGPKTEDCYPSWYMRKDDNWQFILEDVNHDWACTSFIPSNLIPRPVEWDGTGLPPVGAKVILRERDHAIGEVYREMIGVEVEVVAVFRSPAGFDMIACALPDGLCGCFRAEMAEPIRTPEQIAYEQEQAAIAPVLHIMKNVWGFITPDMGSDEKRLEAIARQLYRDGYIKAGEGGHVQP